MGRTQMDGAEDAPAEIVAALAAEGGDDPIQAAPYDVWHVFE
jgi:hypothetical protein